MLEQAKLQI